MANLTLDRSTIGYDKDQIATALKNINYKVIELAKQKMDTELGTLKTAVDACWQGNSAEQFKRNMDVDEGIIKKGLDDCRIALFNEFGIIVKAVATIDEELIVSRAEGGSN